MASLLLMYAIVMDGTGNICHHKVLLPLAPSTNALLYVHVAGRSVYPLLVLIFNGTIETI